MISWFSTSRIRAYVKLSTKKQNQVKMGLDQRYSEQKSVLDSRLTTARACARKAHRLLSRGKEEKAKEKEALEKANAEKAAALEKSEAYRAAFDAPTVTQPAIFVTELALGRTLVDLGVDVAAVGHGDVGRNVRQAARLRRRRTKSSSRRRSSFRSLD